MADLEGMIAGPAARWLEERREELNGRFARARRRFPALDGQRVLAALMRFLPPVAGDDDLCSSVYDLVLLHEGRGTLAARPGVGLLLGEAFARLRPVLARAPRTLPGALSNAVENLGERGGELARALGAIGPRVDSPEALLSLGAILAWRLGEARLRRSAMAAAALLPARAVLDALDLGDWPEAAAPVAIASLDLDGWTSPRARISAATLDGLGRGAVRPDVIGQALRKASTQSVPLDGWRIAARVGDFTGFGGPFEVPPVVLDGGERHLFHVAVGERTVRIEADLFGWSASPEPDPGLSVRAPAGRRRRWSRGEGGHDLAADGTLSLEGARAKHPALAGATGLAILSSLVVVSIADSHRLRLLAPARPAL